jgi:hypothetical protein
MTDQVAPVVEAYSSRGPATSCWEPSRGSQASAALPACTTRTVGTLGTDGVATTVPGFNPFFGTSAASPHVAAVAALMRQHAPCSTPAAIHDALRAGAVPLGSEPDASGAGRTDAVGAIEELAACPVTLPAPRFPWLGRVKADRVTMSLYTPDSVVGEPTNYRLQVLRPGGSVVTTHELPVTNGERYLGPEILLTPGTAYRFRVQVDVGGQTTPWSPPSPLVIQPFRSLSVFLNQLATDLTVDGFTGEERELISFLVEADYSPGFAALTASQVKNWGPMIDPVTRLYYAYFGRKPDPSGLEHWLQRRRAGVLLDQISGTFAASSEFTRKYGSLTNRGFVELVYRNVLGRAGDPGGITYWTKQLDTKARKRGQVMTGFSESNEHLRKRRGEVVAVNLSYGLLRRIPTNAELATWVPQIGSPDRIAGDRAAEALAQTIFTSLEYIDRVS